MLKLFLCLLFISILQAQDCNVNNGGCTDRHDCSGSVGSVTCACKTGFMGNATLCTPSYTYTSLGCYVQTRGQGIKDFPVYGRTLTYGYDKKSCFLECIKYGHKYYNLINNGLCACGDNDDYARWGATGGCIDGKGAAWKGSVYKIDPVMVTKVMVPGECSAPTAPHNVLGQQPDNTVTADACATAVKTTSECWKGTNTYAFALHDTGRYCYCDKANGNTHRNLDATPSASCHTSYIHGVKCLADTDCLDNNKCFNGACAPCPICDGVDPSCQNVQPAGPGKCGCSKCLDKNVPMKVDNCASCQNYINLGTKNSATDKWNPTLCMNAVKANSQCHQVPATKENYFFMHNATATEHSYCYCAKDSCNPNRFPETSPTTTYLCTHQLWKVGAPLLPACPVSFVNPLTSACSCSNNDCAVGNWCYSGACHTVAKCETRRDVHKNIFYGAKVYGKWNQTTQKMRMVFNTPWDVTVSSITWKKAKTTGLKYEAANHGVWTLDKTTDPCNQTHILDVPQTDFFGDGSNFTIKGSQLSTIIRVDASEQLSTEKNGETYRYTRRIKNAVPVLVNLITKTVIRVRFRTTAAPPGPGPKPKLEDFVLFVSAEDNFADGDQNVIVIMKVYSRTCVDHTLADTGVRVTQGSENIKTGANTNNFAWTNYANGTAVRSYEHDMCMETLTWTFKPKAYKDDTYEITLQFDNRDIAQKFSVIAAIDIKQGDVLDDIGFTSEIATYKELAATNAVTSFHLGDKFYSLITLSNLIVNTHNITCKTYKIKQTKNGATTTTDMKAELKYNFVQQKHSLNKHVCGAELESHHFHTSVNGFDTQLETEIEIHYDQSNTRRHLISIPLSGSVFDNAEEVGLGASDNGAELDKSDMEFRETPRAPDTDDMIVKMYIEAEAQLAEWISKDSSRTFMMMMFCFMVVGTFGFGYGYQQSKSSTYKAILDGSEPLTFVEMHET